MRLFLSLLLLPGLTAPIFAAQQQPPSLAIPADEPYKHAPSGLVIPTTLDGLPRYDARAFSPDHLDEAFNFGPSDLSEDITVFVFRNVTGGVPVWFDRTARVVEHRDVYGDVMATKAAAPFTPPGQTNASGLIVSYRPTHGPYRSTAMAYLPLGPEWYVELRYSSFTIDADAIDARLRGAIAGLGWPRKIAGQPAAAPVVDCTTPLALSGKAAVVKGENAMASSLFAGVLASASLDEKKKIQKGEPAGAPQPWCRDTGVYPGLEQHGVYRPTGTNDRYLLAFNDAGRGIWVAPDELAAILAKDHGTSAATWSVTFNDVAATTAFAGRDRLPPPDQAYDIMRNEPYASKSGTWGKKRDVQVNSDSLK